MLLIIQNDPEVPPGNFNEIIGELNISCSIAHPYNGEALPLVRDISAGIVLGGAMGVHDTAKHPFLVGVKAFIGECVRSETPFLGVCLGGQLLSDVLGGRVIADSPYGEKGSLPVSLTSHGRKIRSLPAFPTSLSHSSGTTIRSKSPRVEPPLLFPPPVPARRSASDLVRGEHSSIRR